MYDFITIGSATRDVFFKTDYFELRKHRDSPTGEEQCFPLGSKIEVQEMILTTGGGGANAAVTFSRQGWRVAMLGVVGDDFNGQEILRELKAEGVETKYFQTHHDDFTAYSVILVNASGERTILSYKGEGQHFDMARVPFDQLETKWFYLNSLGGNADLLRAVVELALKKNIKIAMNPGGKELDYGLGKLMPILKHMDLFITNREEGAELLERKGASCREVLNKLKEMVGGITVVTDGPRGVLVSDASGITYQAGVPASPVVERTGAGDAWSSGFTSEYLREGNIVKAIQFGTANASSVVTQFGAKAGILKRGDWGSWPLVEVETLNTKSEIRNNI